MKMAPGDIGSTYTSGFSAEERFLAEIFVLSKPVLSSDCNMRKLDWEKIVMLADSHWLGYYLLKAINTLKIKVSKKNIKIISGFKEREHARYLYFRKKLPHVLEALNKAKINYALLKGGFLAFDLYPAGARYLSDIDILLPKKEKKEAIWALYKVGFKEDKNRSNTTVSVMTDANGMEVELATELGVLKNILPASELLFHAVNARVLNTRTRVLNPEYNLLHLCLHASMTHSFYDLSKLVDINEVLKVVRINLTRVEELARKKGVFRAVFLPIQMCGVLWGNKSGKSYSLDAGVAEKLVRYNLGSVLKTDYDRKSVFYAYLIPVLLTDSWYLKYKMFADYLTSRKIFN